MRGPVAGSRADSWIREAVVLTVTATVEAAEDLLQQYPTTRREYYQDIIINRIIRGVLWTIHNGNAPGRDPLSKDVNSRLDDRTLECSLSSKWLEGDDLVYIS